VVWSDLVEQNRRQILGSRLLAVGGQVQKQGLVVHLLARRFEDLTALLGELHTTSHDFH
jgi:error-prone DNA polymerase